MNPNVNYGLRVVRFHFIDDNMSHSSGDIDSGGSYVVQGRSAEGIGELSVLSAQFCCDPKTALTNKID